MASILDNQRIKSLERDVKSLLEVVKDLQERMEALEAKRGPGRPRKEDDGYAKAHTGN